jgi:hypothetical protein
MLIALGGVPLFLAGRALWRRIEETDVWSWLQQVFIAGALQVFGMALIGMFFVRTRRSRPGLCVTICWSRWWPRQSREDAEHALLASPQLLVAGGAVQAASAQLPPIPRVTESQVAWRVQKGHRPLSGSIHDTDGRRVRLAKVWVDADSLHYVRSDSVGGFALSTLGRGSHRLAVEIGAFRRLVSSVTVLPDTYLTAAVILVRLEVNGPGSGFKIEMVPLDTSRTPRREK